MTQAVTTIADAIERVIRLLASPLLALLLASRFEQVPTAPGHIAYVRRRWFRKSIPEDYACPTCRQELRVSILQLNHVTIRQVPEQSPIAYFRCHRCDCRVKVETDRSPFESLKRAAVEQKASNEEMRRVGKAASDRRRARFGGYWD